MSGIQSSMLEPTQLGPISSRFECRLVEMIKRPINSTDSNVCHPSVSEDARENSVRKTEQVRHTRLETTTYKNNETRNMLANFDALV